MTDNKKARWVRSLLDSRQSLWTPSEGWLTVALLLAVQLVTVCTLQNSGWVEPMPRLWLVGLLALVLSLGVAKLRGPVVLQVIAHVAFFGLGGVVCLAETSNMLDGSASSKVGEMFSRMDAWLEAVSSQGISNDRLPFALMLVATSWMVMYLSTIFTFRLHWPWMALIPPAIGLMTNMTYLPSSWYAVPVTLFLLFGMLFMGRLYFLQRTSFWGIQGLLRRIPRSTYVINAVVLTALVLGVAWALPVHKLTFGPLKETYRMARSPWAGLEDDFERMFAGIASNKASPLHSFGSALPLRGGVSLGGSEVFVVTTDFPSYWRAQSYDYYQGRGWIAKEGQRRTVVSNDISSQSGNRGYRKRELVAQKIELKLDSPIIFASGQPVEISVPAQIELSEAQIYEISLVVMPEGTDLPSDLLKAADRLVRLGAGPSEAAGMMPEGTTIVRRGRDSILVSREAPSVPDILSAKSSKRLGTGATYEVLSSVSVATASELRRDGRAYPKWVTDNYLQLPPELPLRTKELATQLTKGAMNPYDKCLAIAVHLRNYLESYNIQPPPLNADAVDYFLFNQRAGYSDYFASAAAVLLRASGVPTRLASGYATGIWNQETSAFVVHLSDAHSWPEVYFPTYGWIPFEPSPSKQPIPRGPLGEPELTSELGLEQDSEDIPEEFLPDDEELLPDEILPDDGPRMTDFVMDIGEKIGIAVGVLAGGAVAMWLVFAGLWQVNFLGLSYSAGIYSRLSKLGSFIWRGPKPTETPSEYAASFAGHIGVGLDSMQRIASGFEKDQYSGNRSTTQERGNIENAWKRVRQMLFRQLLGRFNPMVFLRRS